MSQSSRVLVVEDDERTLDLFCQAIRQAGLEADGAISAAQALEALGQRRYDAVVADYVLPDVAGLDWLAALSGAAPETTLILCSGFLTEQLRAEAMDFRFFAVLEKPVSLADLVGTLVAGVRGSS